MSGTVGHRARKQWQIQDGPRGTLRRLRNQLAEDGCVESQVVIAKHLLDEAEDSGDWTESTTQAVHWLMRAAEYGSEEASALLAGCFKSGTGISEENYERVRACLSMTREERAFRQAARGLFGALTPLGQEFVTTSQLRARLSSPEGVAASQAETSGGEAPASTDEADASFRYEDTSIFDGQHLSEERLADIAARVSRGRLPRESLGKEDSGAPVRQSKVLTKRIFETVRSSWSSSSARAVDWIARYGDRFLLSLLPWSQLRTFGLLLLCTLLPLETVLGALPLVAFWAALAVMLVSTLRVLRNRKRFDTFEQWLRIFGSAGCEPHARCAEANFCCRRLRPIAHFFAALLVLLAASPLCGETAVPRSELVSLFGVLALLCLFRLNASTRLTWAFTGSSLLLAAARTVHACSAVDHMPWIMRLELKLDILDCATASLSLSSLTAVAVLAAMLKMAAAERWHGTYKTVLPNAVALAWLQLAVAFAPQASPHGVLLGAALLGGILALPAVLAVAAACSVLYALAWVARAASGAGDLPRLLTTLGCLAAAVAAKWFVDRRDRLGHGAAKKCLTAVQIACGVFAALQLLPALDNLEIQTADRGPAVVDWQTYHGLCHAPAWGELTVAQAQQRCGQLAGAPVSWAGQVRAVKILQTQNRLEELLAFLPAAVGRRLRCVYGEAHAACDRERMAEHEFKVCALAELAGRRSRCHVGRWSRHQFEVHIQMSGGYWNTADVVLAADDSFSDFALLLSAGDQVRFSGRLMANVGAPQPRVLLLEVECENCVRDMPPAVGRRRVDLSDEIRAVRNFVFDYFFYPFVELKSR